MIKATYYNSNGEKNGEVELPIDIFGINPIEAVVHQYVKAYLANQRQGTAKVKTRSEVSGGGKKPWKQKGTGKARIGSTRAPHWRHGGVVFGPSPRSYRQRLPKKMKRLAMISMLADRAQEGRIAIISDINFEKISTKNFMEVFGKTGMIDNEKLLYVTSNVDTNAYLSSRNAKGVSVTHMGELNPYQVLLADNVILSESALNMMKERWLEQ